MGLKNIRWVGALIALGALTGCDDAAGSGGAGGAGVTASSSSSDTSSGSQSTGTTSSSGSASTSSSSSSSTGTGGGGPSDCTKLLLELCKQQKACAPHLFAAQWETDAICAAEAERLCTDLPSSYSGLNPGVQDPAACEAALSGSCSEFLTASEIHPDACRPLPGDKVEFDGCLLTAQCGEDMFCIENLFEPQHGANCSYFCTPYSDNAIGQQCLGSDNLCNPSKGRFCTYLYDDTKPNKVGTGPKTCQTYAYQPLGAGCNETTEKRCGSGLGCKAPNTPNAYTCVNLLSEGQACKVGDVMGKDPCDSRLGLACLPKPDDPTKTTCQAPLYVPVNAQCGLVTDMNGIKHNQVCSNYAYCSATTNLCVRKSQKGEGCVAGGCYPPYQCTAGTCSDPAIQVDPVCTVAP
ncbi:MAG: hypothetical protein U0414_06220 [Polyangiaceae bacterium]